MKQCTQCFLVLPPTEFSKRTVSPDGLQPKCKKCNKENNDTFRKKHPEYKKEWDKKHPGAQSQIVKNFYSRSPDKHKKIVYRYFKSWGAGIFLVTNNITQEKYVGSTTLLRERYNAMNNGFRGTIQKSLLKYLEEYGPENFTFKILEKVEDVSTLRQRKQYWIEVLQPEYNTYK